MDMPAMRHIGLTVTSVEPDRSVLELPCRPEVTFDGKHVQGGIVGVLGEIAAILAPACELPYGWRPLSLTCDFHSLAPAAGDRLIAVGRTVRAGKRQMVGRSEVFVDRVDGTLCCTGLYSATAVPPTD